MLRNYFKITWRTLRKDTQTTILNLLGLSTGLACAMMIFLWVNDELNVDRFHEKDSRLYQKRSKRQILRTINYNNQHSFFRRLEKAFSSGN